MTGETIAIVISSLGLLLAMLGVFSRLVDRLARIETKIDDGGKEREILFSRVNNHEKRISRIEGKCPSPDRRSA